MLESNNKKAPNDLAGRGAYSKSEVSMEQNKQYSKREILYMVQNEDVIHLDDLVLRRTLMAYLGQVSIDAVKELADIVGGGLGWSEERRQKEIDRTVNILAEQHGVSL